MEPIRVGDRFTIGPNALGGWTKLPRTIIRVIGDELYYCLDNGDRHTVDRNRLNRLLRDKEWLVFLPECVHLPVGA